MDIHEWIGEYAGRAIEARDREQYQLVALTGQALPLVSRDPDRALELLEEGRALAERLNEPWFARFFEHWTIQVLLFHKRDPNKALPMAEAAVRETAKPVYAELPQRICLREDVIFSYLSRDPLGYGPEIEEAIQYMQAEIPPDCACLHCFQEIRTAYPLAIGQLEEAEQAALEAVKLAWPASDYHHVLIAFTSLCQVAWQRQDWPKLLHWSGMGRTFEGRDVGISYVRELLMWQATAMRRSSGPQAAERYRHARVLMRSLPSAPTAGYFDALFAYHEAGTDLRPLLAVCDMELEQLSGCGETMRECRVRLRRRRLLLEREKPVTEEDEAIQALAQTLRDPQPILSQLAGLPLAH